MNIVKYKGLEVNPSVLSETMTIEAKRPSIQRLSESTELDSYLLPRIEAIHAGTTRNYNHYPADKLKGDPIQKTGVYSWTQPYAKPVIYNHDTDTEVTGRIMRAAYAEYTQAGRPGIILIPKITEPKAVEALKAGRLLTVSIGATTDAAICSICGTDIINEGYCGHMKGEEYEGRTAEWISGNLWFDELSWVNVPADENAMVVDTQSSLFIDGPMVNPSSQETANQSPILSLSEAFGVPRGVNLVVSESKEFNETNKQEQEENDNMEKEKETVVVEQENDQPVVTPEVEAEKDEKEVKSNPVDETKVEPEAEKEVEPTIEVEPEKEAKDVTLKAESIESESIQVEGFALLKSKAEEALEIANEGLTAQVNSLTKELKNFYIQQIIESSNVPADKLESFENRLKERTIDSIRDKLEDIQEGFVAPTKKVEEEAPVTRKVTKVASPVPATETVTKTKEATDEDKVNLIASMLK